MSKIIQNAAKITEGNQVTYLVSKHQHDFVQYKFKSGEIYALDGGKIYLKRSGNINSSELIEDYSLTEESSFEECCQKMIWGHFNKDGSGPLKRSPFAELELDHLKAILDYNAKLAVGLSDLQIKVINHWITIKESEIKPKN